MLRWQAGEGGAGHDRQWGSKGGSRRQGHYRIGRDGTRRREERW